MTSTLGSTSDGIELPMLAPHNGKRPSDHISDRKPSMLLEPNGISDKNKSFDEEVEIERKPSIMMSKKRLRSFESEDSIVFHRDPFNKPEHIITLRGRELVFFVVGYIIAVVCILGMFELVMPVIFTNDSPRGSKRA